MRTFATADLINPEEHYCIPPLERWDLERVLTLIRDRNYFALHAPLQSGKTSVLWALRDLLNSGEVGDYRCVYASMRGAYALADVEAAMRVILNTLRREARWSLQDDTLQDLWSGMLERSGGYTALARALSRWAEADPRPLVLLFDDYDKLADDVLISMMRQLRSGFTDRPQHFPQTVVLCGTQDVRDYRLCKDSVPYNIQAAMLRLEDFSREQVFALLGQHTEETGQAFSAAALETVWERTQGQPYLVNALAERVCGRRGTLRESGRAIEAEDIRQAEDALILDRKWALGHIVRKLDNPHVQPVVEPMLTGGQGYMATREDLDYVWEVGLIRGDSSGRFVNPIYAEVMLRKLTAMAQEVLDEDPAWYVEADGALNVEKLLEGFQQFFRENSEHWSKRFAYKEAWPQLLLQAFLQRIVNGSGRIEREHELGRRRTGLLVAWAQEGQIKKHAIECKLLHKGLEQTMAEGLEQTAGYMDRCGAESGHLVVFDRDEGKKWEEKIFRRSEAFEDVKIEVWGM